MDRPEVEPFELSGNTIPKFSVPLLFQSGFEANTRGLPDDAHEIVTGADESVDSPNDWDAFRPQLPPQHPWALPGAAGYEPDWNSARPKLGYCDIQYLGGTTAERFARIIEDPTCPGNHVLHFNLAHPNEKYTGGAKGRVQVSIYRNSGLRAIDSSVKIYLHPDLDVLRDWEAGFNWLTLQELWFGPSWEGGKHPFRISLGLCRAPGPGRKDMHFNVHGQPALEKGMPLIPKYSGWGRPAWEGINEDFAVPTGRWLECRTIYRMGDATTGRFIYRVRPAGGEWVDIFDVNNWTYNPLMPQPVPLTDWNPMKLYTSSALINHVRACGGTVQVYWDDFCVYGS